MRIVAALSLLFATVTAFGGTPYYIGVCDWMILKRQKLGEFLLAKQLGADGVELDMGGLGKREAFDNKLRNPEQARKFRHTADSLGVKIGAVAMSGFYGQNLTQKATYMALLEDCLDTMDKMDATVCFLPLGGCGDWTGNTALRAEMAKRLHQMGERAKARGKVIGIDTPLDAEGNLKFLNEIGSTGVRIFYKFQTMTERGINIPRDLKRLGKENICAIHASNPDGVWLKNDKTINLKKIRRTLDKMGWGGWLFVERSRDTTQVRNVKLNFSENVKHLKTIFQ